MQKPSTRVVAIAGSHNLRDMGGYRAMDGRQIKWGTLFRSGLMSGLAEEDFNDIRGLGVVAIYDLRGNHERAGQPTKWHEGQNVDYHSRDYELSVGDLDKLIRNGNPTAENVHASIQDVYRELPFEQADSYRELFRLLIRGRLPLLFNCTAGKDRTGVAAALILFALGVDRESIEYDYSLTDLSIDRLEQVLLGDPRYVRLAALKREQYLPILRADPTYIAIAFQEIERRCGSVANYLESVMNVAEHEIVTLCDRLLM